MALINPVILGRSAPAPSSEWVRPTNWLPIPSISAEEEVIYLISKVYNVDNNFSAFLCQGDYTVDWGDGVVENYNDNTLAMHSHAYSALTSQVIDSEYKQALIKITPQPGFNLTAFNLQQIYTGLYIYASSNFQEIVISAPNISGTNLTLGGSVYFHRNVENVNIKNIGNITTAYKLFIYFSKLVNVSYFNTASCNSTSQMFYNCHSLKYVPNFDMSSVINCSYMFYACNSISTVPVFNLPIATTATYMFYGCNSLKELKINLPSAPSLSSFCNGCFSLIDAVVTTGAALTNISQAFVNCNNLLNVAISNTNNVTNIAQIFQGCFTLKKFTAECGAVTNTGNAFLNCYNLSSLILNNLHYGFSIQYCQMGPNELNALFTSLGTETGTQTIVISNNYGSATCDPTIASAKGFTVTL